jgi:outer membrane protein OmpA-like peptidoglycan-associated protein
MRLVHWLLAATLATSFTADLPAQGIGALAKRKAEEAKRKAEEAKKKLEGADKKTTADTAGKGAVPTADSARTAAAPGAASAAPAAGTAAKADPRVWENYDFVPGSRVIFFTDFSDDKVGNFPRRLKHQGGSVDVVERDGVKMTRFTSRSEFLIPVGKQLPQRFTLEIDVIAPPEPCCGQEVISFEGGATLDRGEGSANILWTPAGTAILGSGQNMGNSPVKIPESMQPALMGQVAHVRVLMDSGYFKMYTNERRLYNIPELAFKRDSVIRVLVTGSEEPNLAVYITSIRVAESEVDVLWDALAAKGRWVTQGILFATGKAELRPESRPVLKEIAGTMKQHDDLKLLIEGHTDNVGSAASNLALSDARAAAVKAALVGEFGIAADRLATKGLGDTKPAVPNTTSEGRAQNRRVELVKQ